jgi:hypothetical protein
MVRYLRPGDVAVIAKASRLGTTRSDRLQTMAAITKRGASIYDADTGKGVQSSPKPSGPWLLSTAPRAGRQHAGVEGGTERDRPERLQGNTKSAAAAAWVDLTKAARDVAVECNVGARTLYRVFGPKGRSALAERTDHGDEGTLHTSRYIHQPFAGSPLS